MDIRRTVLAEHGVLTGTELTSFTVVRVDVIQHTRTRSYPIMALVRV